MNSSCSPGCRLAQTPIDCSPHQVYLLYYKMLLCDSAFMNRQTCHAAYQFYGDGKLCVSGDPDAMETPNNALCERSTKGQVRRPNRPEHVIAFEFLRIHYEEDVKADTPVQKSDVYCDYEAYCEARKYKPLVAADFGRILKSMFPNAKDRRLGSRGSSKYCYVGVKKKAENHSKISSANPYSAEDLAKAYQTIVCEWASTVLSRRLYTLDELAKYLLKNRFVQTRSCAALTVTASLKDTDELAEPPPMNKHRETQLKLQEKIKEKFLNKQLARAGSIDDPELRLTLRLDGTASQGNSTSSTPDPEGQLRQVAMQTCSAPGSSRTSPENSAMSVTNSACGSPVFVETVVQKALYPINYHRNGYEPGLNNVKMDALTPINSQCNSVVGSERNTPIAPQYEMPHNGSVLPQYPQQQQYDPRLIQSCPNTPLPGYHQPTFDFSHHVGNNTAAASAHVSLPNSARNTPVLPEYQETNNFQPDLQRSFSHNGTYQQNFTSEPQNLYSFPNIQRAEFGCNDNSAFMPIKDGGVSQTDLVNSLNQPQYNGGVAYNGACQSKALDLEYNGGIDPSPANNDNGELEINELIDIIENSQTPLSQGMPQGETTTSATGLTMEDRVRPLSAQEMATHTPLQRLSCLHPPQTSGQHSIIYNLLKAGPNTSTAVDAGQRFRHHSGPQLGYAASHKAKYSHHNVTTSASTPGHIDLNSPPSTPNGNFRPVRTPSSEIRMYYNNESQCAGSFSVRTTANSPASIGLPARFSNALVGTMSPPSQPLIKRKRNHSGEKVLSSLLANPAGRTLHAAAQPIADQQTSDYIARRNLGTQLSTPTITSGAQASGSMSSPHITTSDQNGS